MDTVYSEENVIVKKYKPSILKPFYIDLEPTTLMRRIRFLIDFYYGYDVYYLEVKGEIVGYCTITNGRNPRFWFAEDKDIIVGPYYIDEKHRGKGYTTKLVDYVINKSNIQWDKAYIYILNTNISSIRVTEKVGGRFIFHVHNTALRKLIKTEEGEYGIYLIERK